MRNSSQELICCLNNKTEKLRAHCKTGTNVELHSLHKSAQNLGLHVAFCGFEQRGLKSLGLDGPLV